MKPNDKSTDHHEPARKSKRTATSKDARNSDDHAEEPSKKKTRLVKANLDKKFECKHDGCGKSYSRAEHLYRHQLNHTPKQIYRCDYPDCNRYFVRQDLCVRHRERHTTQGSQLHKRDSFTLSSAHTANSQNVPEKKASSWRRSRSPSHGLDAVVPDRENGTAQDSQRISRPSTGIASSSMNDAQALHQGRNPTQPRERRHSQNAAFSQDALSPMHSFDLGGWSAPHQQDNFNSEAPHATAMFNSTVMDPSLVDSPLQAYSDSPLMTTQLQSFKASSQGLTQPGSMPQHHVGSSNRAFQASMSNRQNDTGLYASDVSQAVPPIDSADQFDPATFNPLSATDADTGYGYPIFGGDDFNRSPLVLAEDFAAWLFNDGASGSVGFSPNSGIPNFSLNPVAHPHAPYFLQSPSAFLDGRTIDSANSNPMHIGSIMDRRAPKNYAISDSKRQELLVVIRDQFVERPHDAVKRRKESILAGDTTAHHHILSLTMMHNYISSYWTHQHAQLPILHKPTFVADKTPNLLLLAIIGIGAATLDKAYGSELTDSAAEFANFLAWHVRWEIMRDADFRPPAKLWIFQTLLLIEVYEKMYSTRALHERAHIHHDSTLTLMRRGSSLTGKAASATSSNAQEDAPRADSMQNSTNVKDSQTSWEIWIDGEATRRVAFAAFVIDSIHCTMFGHSAKMVAHEMRLPLPCDEGLWSAGTPTEASRLHSLLASRGVKQIMFLDSLRKTLRGERVRTNTFGRTIIMAGLLSVSYHMNQRDIQMMSLGQGRPGTFGLDKSWKSLLLRAYDNWKKDFDESLGENTSASVTLSRMGSMSDISDSERLSDSENIFESRTVLHHLAHIAAHVDIVACQIFAGANRLLSRSVTPKDYTDIKGKVEKWATKASARDSAFYALKFIAQVLMPAEKFDPDGSVKDGYIFGIASPILPQAFEHNRYIARDDFLLNRPWVLYVSALVVWCYGFALEGPIVPPPYDEEFATYEQREADMKSFLDTVAAVEAPDDLQYVTGKNRCLGLLLILKESFESTRWELTHEASRLLGLAAQKLKGDSSVGTMSKRRK